MTDPERLAAWCDRLRASDHRAFEAIFRALHDPLLNYAIYLTRSRAVALDITQDAFVKLWEKRETLDPGRSIKALLYLIDSDLAGVVVDAQTGEPCPMPAYSWPMPPPEPPPTAPACLR